MAAPPLPEVVTAIEAPSTRITRRVQFFESDGVTEWEAPNETPRLIDGNVTVDYARDERRAVDLLLNNTDGVLKHNPRNGLWYDKIVKVYRGIEYDVRAKKPRILIIHDTLSRMRAELRNLGFPDAYTNLNPSSIADFEGYDIIVADAYQGSVPSPKVLLLLQAYAAGFHVFTCGNDGDESTIPFVTASVFKNTDANWSMTLPTFDTPLIGNWGSVANFGSNEVGKLPTALSITATPIALMTYNGVRGYPVIANQNTDGTRWVQLGIAEREANTRQLIKNSITWLYGSTDRKSYEAQVGVFMIDRIDEEYFPEHVKITGRDYTKKLMLSRIGSALTFTAGTAIATIVSAVASNAGVFAFKLDTGGKALAVDISFEKNTTRWEIIKTICEAYQLEVFFDMSGVLNVRAFQDPLLSPIAFTLAAGQNLVSYSKSSNDSRIFNHVTVTSDNQDQIAAGQLIFAEAKNDEPSSPTRISRLGTRTDPIVSSVVADNAQALAMAEARLKVSALESYELNWSTLVYPWLEAGQILRFEDPRPGVDEPDRFLMDTFGVPLGLSPMSGTGKRVTIVGSGSTPGASLFTGTAA